MQEQNWLASRFYSQQGSHRKGFTWRGREFQKTTFSIIRHIRWSQPNCKQWRKSRAPDNKWKLYNRQDQIHFWLPYNHGTSWQGYFKTDSGVASFYSPYSLTANACSKKSDSLTWIKSYLLFCWKLLFQQWNTRCMPDKKTFLLHGRAAPYSCGLGFCC